MDKEGNEIQPSDESKVKVSFKLEEVADDITDKSPKRFRITLVSRLQNYSLEAIENLIRSNEMFVAAGDMQSAGQRLAYQRDAMTALKLLSYMSELAMKQGCILPKQYEQITKQVYDAENMLGAWMNSDKRRYGSKT